MVDRFAVRPLTPEDVDIATGVLARAFFDYPMWTWILPDEDHRRRALPVAMRQAVRWGLLTNEAYVTGDPVHAVALCAPGAIADADLDPDGSKTGWPEMDEALGNEAVRRLELLVSTQRMLRARDIPPGGLYLACLGVTPEAQRTGAGSALLRAMFARTDTATYLETEKAANVPYYERHGYRVLVADAIADGGPPYWTMLREPSGASAER